MTSAIDRLTTELENLSNEDWARVARGLHAGQEMNSAFTPAWEEISERLSRVEDEAVAESDSDSKGEKAT